MNRFFYLLPIFLVIAVSQLVWGQAPIVTRDEVDNNVVPQLETMGDELNQATTESANAWTRFVDNTKQALTQSFDASPLGNSGGVRRFNPLGNTSQPEGDSVLGGKFVKKINNRRKRLVKNTKEALTPNFTAPKITTPKITPASFSTPIFNSKPSVRGNNFLRNIVSPATSTGGDKPRRSLLTSWLPSAREPEPKLAPTLGEWQSQERPH